MNRLFIVRALPKRVKLTVLWLVWWVFGLDEGCYVFENTNWAAKKGCKSE